MFKKDFETWIMKHFAILEKWECEKVCDLKAHVQKMENKKRNFVGDMFFTIPKTEITVENIKEEIKKSEEKIQKLQDFKKMFLNMSKFDTNSTYDEIIKFIPFETIFQNDDVIVIYLKKEMKKFWEKKQNQKNTEIENKKEYHEILPDPLNFAETKLYFEKKFPDYDAEFFAYISSNRKNFSIKHHLFMKPETLKKHLIKKDIFEIEYEKYLLNKQ